MVNEYYGKKNMHWTDFDAAAVMQSPLYQRLEESSKDLDKTLADIDEAAKDAIAAEEAHFAKAQQEIELDALLAQEQRRKEMGWQKGAAVVLTLAVDIVVIVGTAGCAAPVVIGVTTAAGTATGAYSFAIDSKINQYVEKGTIDLGEMGYVSLKGGIVGGTTSLIGSSVGQWVKGIKEVDEIAKVLKPASKTVKTEAVKTLLTLGIDGSSSIFTGVTTGVVTRFEKAAMDSLHCGDGLGESLASGIHDAVNLTRIREDTVHGLTSAVTDYVLGELEDIVPGDLSDLERPKTKGEMASSLVRSGWIGGTENVISTIIDDTVGYFYDEDADKASFVEEVFNGGNIAKSALKGSTKKMAKTYGKEETEQLKQEIQQDLAAIEDDIIKQLNARNDQVSLDLNIGEEIAEDRHQRIGLHESLSDERLFESYEDGVYEENKLGRSASQTLHYTPDTKRDKSAQLAAGGDDRRNDDHGFHLIGVAEGGSPGKENLDAGNGNLNQGSYRRRELSEISDLKEGASSFKHVESFKSNGSDRPDAFMGFTITEDRAGKRTWDAFSYQNENVKTQEGWNKTADANSDYSNSIPNAMRDGNYDEIQRIIHQDDT